MSYVYMQGLVSPKGVVMPRTHTRYEAVNMGAVMIQFLKVTPDLIRRANPINRESEDLELVVQGLKPERLKEIDDLKIDENGIITLSSLRCYDTDRVNSVLREASRDINSIEQIGFYTKKSGFNINFRPTSLSMNYNNQEVARDYVTILTGMGPRLIS